MKQETFKTFYKIYIVSAFSSLLLAFLIADANYSPVHAQSTMTLFSSLSLLLLPIIFIATFIYGASITLLLNENKKRKIFFEKRKFLYIISHFLLSCLFSFPLSSLIFIIAPISLIYAILDRLLLNIEVNKKELLMFLIIHLLSFLSILLIIPLIY